MPIRMTYYKYKARFSHLRTVPGSYRKRDKTILVIVPQKPHV